MSYYDKTEAAAWEKISYILPYASAIAWDGCHKIYVLMDPPQVDLMREYGYNVEPAELVTLSDVVYNEATQAAALENLKEWFNKSCELKFVESVSTHYDPNKGYRRLIAQGEADEWVW